MKRFLNPRDLPRSEAWYSRAHQNINGKHRHPLSKNLEWGLLEMDFELSRAIEDHFDGKTLQIPVVVAPEIPGHVLGNHAIQTIRKKGLYCPRINWAPRRVTVQMSGTTKPNAPLKKAEKDLQMPEKVFSWEDIPELDSNVHLEFYCDSEGFWEECGNLIRRPVTVTVLHLFQRYPTIFGKRSVQILNRALQATTKGKKEISLIDWVPSSIIVDKL